VHSAARRTRLVRHTSPPGNTVHPMAGKAGARGWGHIRRLPSGNLQASYIGPDRRRHTAPMTYTDSRAGKVRAQKWLGDERELMEAGSWTPAAQRAAARSSPNARGASSTSITL
jgi:hypothetical protein